MKKIMIVLTAIIILLFPTAAFAMQFSQPVELGSLRTKDGIHYYASPSILASSVKNSYYDFGRDERNIVRFYVGRDERFGSATDKNNTVKCWMGLNEVYELKSDSGVIVYIIKGQGSDGAYGIEFVGKDKNGKFFKYIGYDDGFRKYYKESRMNYAGALGNELSFRVEGDTLILDCGLHNGAKWKYILKWDEAAQWFGIEYQEL